MVHGESQVLLRSKGLGPMGVWSGLKMGPRMNGGGAYSPGVSSDGRSEMTAEVAAQGRGGTIPGSEIRRS